MQNKSEVEAKLQAVTEVYNDGFIIYKGKGSGWSLWGKKKLNNMGKAMFIFVSPWY